MLQNAKTRSPGRPGEYLISVAPTSASRVRGLIQSGEEPLSALPADAGGDEPINLTALTMTAAAVSRLAGVRHQSMDNWQRRNIMQFGKMPAYRQRYSVLDAVRLAVVGSLSERGVAPLEVAGMLAEAVAQHCLARPPAPPGGPRPNRNLVLAWGDYGPLVSWVDTTGRPGMSAQYPPRHADAERAAMRRPYVVIPADAIIDDVILRTQFVPVHTTPLPREVLE
jgi:hypothetical protein